MKGFLFSVLLVAATTCFGQRFNLALSTPLAGQHEQYSVKGRQGLLIRQKLSFGGYFTTEVKRGAIKSWRAASGFPGLIWKEHMEGRQSIRFRLSDQQDTSQVLMLTNISATDLKLGNDPNAFPNQIFPLLTVGTEAQQNNLSAAIYFGTDEQPWELYLDNTDAQLRRESYTGYVYKGEEYYQIVPVWEVLYKDKKRRIPFGAAGFEIVNADGEAVAAVSLMDNKGIVYLGNVSPREKFLMANVCATLLLQSNISPGDLN